VAQANLAEKEEQMLALIDAEEERREMVRGEVIERKQVLEAARLRHLELEHAIGEERRLEGQRWVEFNTGVGSPANVRLVHANRERFIRQKANLEELQHAQEEERLAEEVSQAIVAQAVEERRLQKVLDVKATLAQRAEAREAAGESCLARKDMLQAIAYQEKVEEVVAKHRLAELQDLKGLHLAELEESIDERARLKEEKILSARLRVQEEKEDGRLQALVEMEEARAVMEDHGISVNMIGLQVDASKQTLALEHSLDVHENRARRLEDRCDHHLQDEGSLRQISNDN